MFEIPVLYKNIIMLIIIILFLLFLSVNKNWNEFINKAIAERDKEAEKDPSVKDKAFGAAISSGKATFYFPKEKKTTEKPKEPSPSNKSEEPKSDTNVPKEEPKGPMEEYSNYRKMVDLLS